MLLRLVSHFSQAAGRTTGRTTARSTLAAPLASPLAATVTYAREVVAHGLFGRLRQRGLAITEVHDAQRPTIALIAYTEHGPSDAARLEIPVTDLRRLARALLDLADRDDRRQGLSLRPAHATLTSHADLRRAG